MIVGNTTSDHGYVEELFSSANLDGSTQDPNGRHWLDVPLATEELLIYCSVQKRHGRRRRNESSERKRLEQKVREGIPDSAGRNST